MEAVLNVNNIKKSFGVVQALNGVNMDLYPREIIGLVGENGAGKSTLMKILLGIHNIDAGEIVIRGQSVTITGPKDANSRGICMVFQELSLLNNMCVYENMFLGFEHFFLRRGMLDKKNMIRTARKEFDALGLNINPKVQVHKLSFVQKQMVEIIKNLWIAKYCGTDNPIIILDEPTSTLGEKDASLLFEQINELKKQATIVFISHKLSEVVNHCDRVYVLKDGYNNGLFHSGELSENLLRESMVGNSFEGEYYLTDLQRKPGDKVVLEVKTLSKKGSFEDVSFRIREGEILSLAGTLGSGKEQVCDVIYGLTQADTGEIYLEGKKVRIRKPSVAVKRKIGLSPEDRKGKALIMGFSVADNIALPTMKGVISPRKIRETAVDMIGRFKIKTPSERILVRQLSGGNQQKVVMAKLISTDSKLIILSHPTRGVDVGAKREIYALIRELADRGVAILLMGDSFEEDIGLSNTIFALRDGKCTGVLDATDRKPTMSEFIRFVV